MREILFRGKSICSICNKEWVIGDYLAETPDHGPWILPIGADEEVPIVKETVGQYTGILDKNGKRIFEGDIVKHFDNSDLGYDIGTIEWDESGCRYRRTTDTAKYTNYCGVINACIYEIIGNIYDNPELIPQSRR